ncbi:MAG: hypothetical protein ACREIJ_10645, partial [Nitrospiraceae bacterium]
VTDLAWFLGSPLHPSRPRIPERDAKTLEKWNLLFRFGKQEFGLPLERRSKVENGCLEQR